MNAATIPPNTRRIKSKSLFKSNCPNFLPRTRRLVIPITAKKSNSTGPPLNISTSGKNDETIQDITCTAKNPNNNT